MSKIKIRILFYIRDKKISVYEYKNGDFEVIQSCGEDIIEYNQDFMSWFKNAIAYVKEVKQLDYLIITDNSVSLDFSEFDIVNESFWNTQNIREFNISKLASQGLILRNVLNREYYRFNVKRNPLEYTVIFCDKNVNRNLEEKKIAQNKAMKPLKKETEKIIESKPKQVEVKQEEIKPKQEEIELEEIAITQEQVSNKEINVAEYYHKLLKEQEEERLKIKPKF